MTARDSRSRRTATSSGCEGWEGSRSLLSWQRGRSDGLVQLLASVLTVEAVEGRHTVDGAGSGRGWVVASGTVLDHKVAVLLTYKARSDLLNLKMKLK